MLEKLVERGKTIIMLCFQEEIKEITVSMLEKLVERGKTMAVLFYDPNDDEDFAIMDELEKIDDDCRR